MAGGCIRGGDFLVITAVSAIAPCAGRDSREGRHSRARRSAGATVREMSSGRIKVKRSDRQTGGAKQASAS